MSEMQAKQRSAVVFGARDLGRAVIELLVSDGWVVTGAARSRSTLDGVTKTGALAIEADVTNPASVYGVLERTAAAHGGVELVLDHRDLAMTDHPRGGDDPVVELPTHGTHTPCPICATAAPTQPS
jgi:nucleoside-diphosphate-sugar epimerase